MTVKAVSICFVVVLTALLMGMTGVAQDTGKQTADTGKAIIWEPVDIKTRDLYPGPGGKEMAPILENVKFIKQETGGNSLKYRIEDGKGREWIAKIADESQPETVAVRLLWGIGYKTEVNYLVPRLSIQRSSRVAGGTFKNVRLEARPKEIKRQGIWSWTNNPFLGTKELDGLKIMMAMFNNWDLKDENTVILVANDGNYYVISDLGASFGRLAKVPQSRSGRSVNEPEHYADSIFIRGARDGVIDFAYTGIQDQLLKGIKIEHGRWLADLLLQLSDNQIQDAFRAANYSDEDVAMFASAFKARINELDRATRITVATQ